MSNTEYTAIEATPLRDLQRIPGHQLALYLQRCNRVQREMIRQAMTAQGIQQ